MDDETLSVLLSAALGALVGMSFLVVVNYLGLDFYEKFLSFLPFQITSFVILTVYVALGSILGVFIGKKYFIERF